jgi:predicted O-methyltransferase YrrM
MLQDKLVALIKSNRTLLSLAEFSRMVYLLIRHRSLKTLTYSPPGHFYSPLPNLREFAANADSIYGKNDSLEGIELSTSNQIELLQKFNRYFPEIPFTDNPGFGLRYHFDNRFFGDGDGIILHSMMRHFQPKQMIEVGSGFSSALILDTNELFFDNKIKLTFIEPYSERLRGLLSDQDNEKFSLIESPIQGINKDVFKQLEKNDILFVDSSHVVKVGSDVAHIIFDILPTLKPGVIIHFHDILWPFEYPQDWINQGISWNEAYFLRAFLQYNNEFEILYFNAYIAECFPQELAQSLPKSLISSGGSLWLRRKS